MHNQKSVIFTLTSATTQNFENYFGGEDLQASDGLVMVQGSVVNLLSIILNLAEVSEEEYKSNRKGVESPQLLCLGPAKSEDF